MLRSGGDLSFRKGRPFAYEQLEENLTVQSEEPSANINNIFERMEKTGYVPVHDVESLVGDFSSVGTFQELQDLILSGRQAFASLPAKVRKRFDNNPADWLHFMEDKGNLDEMVSLGLVTRLKPPEEVVK